MEMIFIIIVEVYQGLYYLLEDIQDKIREFRIAKNKETK